MGEMKLRSYRKFFKHIIFVTILLLSYILQTSCGFIYIHNIVPIVIMSINISVSMFENIFVTCIYSLLSGFLCDMAMHNFIGFNSIFLIIFCGVINILTIYYIKANLASFMVFILISILIENLLIIIFKYKNIHVIELNILLINNILPSVLCAIIVSPLTFLFFSYVKNAFFYNRDVF